MSICSSESGTSVFMETKETCDPLFSFPSGSGDTSGDNSADIRGSESDWSSFLGVFASLKTLIKLTALAFDFFFGTA